MSPDPQRLAADPAALNGPLTVWIPRVLFLLLLARPLVPRLGAAGRSLADGTARIAAWSAIALLAAEAVTVALQTAVLTDDKGSYVLVVGPQNKVERRPVKVSGMVASGVTIADGIDKKDRVVATAGAFLQVGETVRPVAEAAGTADGAAGS